MNKDINLLYEQYKSLGNPETFDEFVQLKDQAGEDIFFEFILHHPFRQVPFANHGFAFPCKIFRTCLLQ